MADFQISTEELYEAAAQLRLAIDAVRPHLGEMAIDLAALGSDEVYTALNTANIQQTARARKLAEDLGSLVTAIEKGADSIEQQDESLADRLMG